MKDEFLAIVSHELRTPLNAILGWSQMLSAGSLDSAGAAKALKIIERNAQLQARLIDDLLDVSRFATGQAVVQAGPVAIGAIIGTAVEAIEPAAAARRISVELTAGDMDVVVDGDPERLQQVLSNLLSNAVKFTPEDGCVRIGVEARVTHVAISVSDSGRGIAADDLPRVFEPFWQVDTTLTRTDSGLGLGLAIGRSLLSRGGAWRHGPGRERRTRPRRVFRRRAAAIGDGDLGLSTSGRLCAQDADLHEQAGEVENPALVRDERSFEAIEEAAGRG